MPGRAISPGSRSPRGDGSRRPALLSLFDRRESGGGKKVGKICGVCFLSFLIETGGNAVEEIRSVHVVLDVFLAGPHDLDGAVDMLSDLNGASDTVDLQPPAKATADEMIGHPPVVHGGVGVLARRRRGARDDLVADPDFAAVLADVDRAVH